MKEIMPKIENLKNQEASPRQIDIFVDEFCSGWKPETDEEKQLFEESLKNLEESLLQFSQEGQKVSYDKRKKEFSIDGKVVPKSYFAVAPIWGKDFAFEEGEDVSFDYKQMRKIYHNAWIKEEVSKKLSPVIAYIEARRNEHKDMFISQAYKEIGKRFENQTLEQAGTKAEQVVRSLLTRISADYQDLKISIYPANPYQDVNQKIDFIIEVTTKRRGVGVAEDENIAHTLGIQFTVNDSKIEHKKQQIEKAKNKITDIDDIVLVAVNQDIMSQALDKWQKSGDSYREPAEFLTYDTRLTLIRELFTNLLKPEDIEKIIKKYT